MFSGSRDAATSGWEQCIHVVSTDGAQGLQPAVRKEEAVAGAVKQGAVSERQELAVL